MGARLGTGLGAPLERRFVISSGSASRSPGSSDGEESACDAGDQVPSLAWEVPLEKQTATLSSILAWRIPWAEEPGGLQSSFHAEKDCRSPVQSIQLKSPLCSQHVFPK